MTAAAWLWIAIGSLVLGAIFSTMHQALRSVSRVALEELLKRPKRTIGTNGNAHESRLTPTLDAIFEDLSGHSAAVAVPRVVCNLLAGLASVVWVSMLRESPTIGLGDTAIGVLGAGILLWVSGVAIPLAIAEHAAERVVASFGWAIRAISVALSPLRSVVAFATEVVRRLAGEASRDTAEAREAEILSLVEESEREGDLDEFAREMIEAVVELRETTVEQIMTPRTEIQSFQYTDDLDAVKKAVAGFTHSRIPVHGESLDNVIGVLYLKDMLRWLVSRGADGPAESFSLKDVLRDATFVPETKTVRELLAELLEEKVHIAFAIDEYGGVSGLVTIEDIIEEVFGEIRDEYEPEEDTEPQVVIDEAQQTAEIDARTEIDDANDELEALELELPESDDWDTVGGFVITTMGKIPEAGETLEHEGRLITVLEAEPTRVVRVRIEHLRPSEAAATAEGK